MERLVSVPYSSREHPAVVHGWSGGTSQKNKITVIIWQHELSFTPGMYVCMDECYFFFVFQQKHTVFQKKKKKSYKLLTGPHENYLQDASTGLYDLDCRFFLARTISPQQILLLCLPIDIYASLFVPVVALCFTEILSRNSRVVGQSTTTRLALLHYTPPNITFVSAWGKRFYRRVVPRQYRWGEGYCRSYGPNGAKQKNAFSSIEGTSTCPLPPI